MISIDFLPWDHSRLALNHKHTIRGEFMGRRIDCIVCAAPKKGTLFEDGKSFKGRWILQLNLTACASCRRSIVVMQQILFESAIICTTVCTPTTTYVIKIGRNARRFLFRAYRRRRDRGKKRTGFRENDGLSVAGRGRARKSRCAGNRN